MGKIKDIVKKVDNLKEIQLLVLANLELIFSDELISDFQCEVFNGKGERGNYYGKLNKLLNLNFIFFEFNFEFYLFYDQLEYYILKNKKVIKSCNLEDYTADEEEMSNTFIKYLKNDMKKLKILFS
jgi:hypothetical protein